MTKAERIDQAKHIRLEAIDNILELRVDGYSYKDIEDFLLDDEALKKEGLDDDLVVGEMFFIVNNNISA